MIYRFGDCELDEERRELHRAGQRVAQLMPAKLIPGKSSPGR